MTPQEIIRLAREAWLSEYGSRVMLGGEDVEINFEDLERFAALVAAAEREACAKVCDLVAREIDDTNGNATYCAAAIRARGQE